MNAIDALFVAQMKGLRVRHGDGCAWCGARDDLQRFDIQSNNGSGVVIFSAPACAICREQME